MADDEDQRTEGRGVGRVRWWVGLVFGLVALVVFAATLCGFLGKFAWWLDVLNELRMQYLWIALVCAAVLLAARTWRWLLAAALAALVINGAIVVPWFFGGPPATPESASRDLRLMVFNVRYSNEKFRPVIDLLHAEHPDVIMLNEVDRQWLAHIRELAPEYAVYDTPTQGNFGVLLLTRRPVDSVEYESFSPRWSPSIVARLTVDGQPIVLISTHPPAPIASGAWRDRNAHLAKLADFVRGQHDPVLVGGDFNTTMWSPHFGVMLRRSGLAATRAGFGVRPTFPATEWGLAFPWPLRVPLDHVLASPDWTTLRCATGPNVGSDHLSLLVDVRLRPTSPRGAAAN